ncbi:hypothetical protein BN946_scf184901.g9 [Trametes cinnabarina]|uniref:Protein-S-isoprenylcysteine O-methyltransferase n=1 Tax=Pycnoporus cinnabarinus TaxID=5643 RepID=A0A060SQS0_PYCCI|nr:hypothetical protein BN946_scf184901.g9 [Trametes cinnabarina]
MSFSLLLIKVPALLAAMIAEYVTYTPPTPPPRSEETQSYNGGDLISHSARIGAYLTLAYAWTVHGCEVVAILAQNARSPSSPTIVSTLFSTPAAARQLNIDPVFLLGLSLLVLAILKEHKLVTWGPYSVVRHPGYTGMIASLLGMFMMQLSPRSWIAVSGVLDTTLGRAVIGAWVVWGMLMVIGFVRRVPREDMVLKKEFGTQWDEWATRVPYTLVPYVW